MILNDKHEGNCGGNMNIKYTNVSFLLVCMSFVTNTMEIQMPQRIVQQKHQNLDEQVKKCAALMQNGKLETKDSSGNVDCHNVLVQYVLLKWHESATKQDVQKKG